MFETFLGLIMLYSFVLVAVLIGVVGIFFVLRD